MSEPCSCHGGCDCGCCAGTEPLTPQTIANRPGLDTLAYRVGTHSSFLETMKARLSSDDFPALTGLTTREANDPAIALLDAWAVVADVLTFYQERIADEGYLRTATERRSVLELARLVGYTPRPGVASSVYLAYTIEEKPKPVVAPGSPVTPVSTSLDEPETLIPAGSRSQSVPGPGEMPQPFETSEAITARAAWNSLQVRLTRPQQPEKLTQVTSWPVALDFQGIATQLKPNDALLADTGSVTLYRVLTVAADATRNRTRVQVEPWLPASQLSPTPVAAPVAAPVTTAAVEAIVARAGDLETHGVTPGATVKRVLAQMDSMQAALGAGTGDAGLQSQIEETLSSLRQELQTAERMNATRLAPWIGRLVADLEAALSDLSAVAPAPAVEIVVANPPTTTSLPAVLDVLGKRPQPQPRNSLQLPRDVETLFAPGSDLAARLLTVVRPELAGSLYTAWANVPVTLPPSLKVCALRTRASVFGHNAPLELTRDPDNKSLITGTQEWDLNLSGADTTPAVSAAPDSVAIVLPTPPVVLEGPNVVYLDNSYPQITPGGWIVLQRPTNLNGAPLVITRIAQVSEQSRAAYGISGRTTRVQLEQLEKPWLQAGDQFDVVRGTAVYVQSEVLPLAEEPIPDPVNGGSIELAGLYDGLAPGRWLIVSGERTDIGGVPGVPAAELVMLAGVAQGVAPQTADGGDAGLPGERTHTTLTLVQPLAYSYKRDTLTIFGNVAHATHGETKAEVMGNGDGGKALQAFTLRQPPLTYVSAPTPSGVENTLQVRVNDLLWHEAESLAALGPTDRSYLTSTDDAGATTVIFGNGLRGARLPTGMANVRAAYRAGIGSPGNVQAGQISQLSTRPLGVKGVVNPIAASGGGDPESRDQTRRNAPLAVLALDRLVSVQDYADFARTFAGIGKASAVRLSNGRVQLVHVTIAGEDDTPILESSDLFQNLGLALRRFGDPRQPVQLAPCDPRLLVVSAEVQVLPDYAWETVAPAVRAAMLAAFGYPVRDLGQPAFLSAAYGTIQGVRGVDLADIHVFDAVTGSLDSDVLAKLTTRQPKKRIAAQPARVDPTQGVQPAQLIYLTPDVADTLILKERKS